MRILLFTPALNGLSQRVHTELVERGHTVHTHLATTETDMVAAAARYNPQLIIAPFLGTAVPENLLKNYSILTVRPVAGADRGPSLADGTPSGNWQSWRVLVQQLSTHTDNGGIWTSRKFALDAIRQGAYYQHHFAQLAAQSIVEAVDTVERKAVSPRPFRVQLPYPLLQGRLHSIRQ